MARGGRRTGAGRRKGGTNQKTIARLKIAEEAAAGGVTPLEVMVQTMRAAWALNTPESILQACRIAVDAAPYIHPRLSSVDQKTTLKGDTLAALLAEIDGTTTGIANGHDDDEQPSRPPLAS